MGTVSQRSCVMRPLLPLPDTQRLHEHYETSENAKWTISCRGKRLYAMAAGDKPALSLLKGITEKQDMAGMKKTNCLNTCG